MFWPGMRHQGGIPKGHWDMVFTFIMAMIRLPRQVKSFSGINSGLPISVAVEFPLKGRMRQQRRMSEKGDG